VLAWWNAAICRTTDLYTQLKLVTWSMA